MDIRARESYQSIKPSSWIDPVAFLARLFLGGTFIYAGAVKLTDVETFGRVIDLYGLSPDFMLVPLAYGLPVLECLAGIGLIFKIRGSLEVVTGMLVMFLFVLSFGIIMDMDVDCGCFSGGEGEVFGHLRQALYRDFGYLAMAAFIIFQRRRRKRRNGEVSG